MATSIHDNGHNIGYYGDNANNNLAAYGSNKLLRRWYLVGNGGNDSLTGGEKDDTLVGGAGYDTMKGGKGHDVYYDYNHPELDTIVESYDQGIDTVFTDHTHYFLGNNLENLNLMAGFVGDRRGLNGYGNSLDNKITGNVHNNYLRGEFGNDTLDGGSGNDVLIGSKYYDSEVDEVDVLIGGSGSDEFRLSSTSKVFYAESGSSDYAVIKDFDKYSDRIRLEGSSSSYVLKGVSNSHGFGTGIYKKGFSSSSDDLVALVQGSTGLNLSSIYFKYV